MIVRLLAAAAAAAAAVLLVEQVANPGGPDGGAVETRARIVDVIDGDTIGVESLTGRDLGRVRLLGIDSPELARGTDPAECYAEAATDELASMLPTGRLVRLRPDPQQRDRDVYGRLLRYAEYDGVDVSTALLRVGAARLYKTDPPLVIQGQLEAAAAEAETTHRGLWRRCRTRTDRSDACAGLGEAPQESGPDLPQSVPR